MTNANRSKGTAWETRIVEWLRPRFPFVERRAQYGALDRGDLTGLPGVVVEAKAQQRLCLPEWHRQLQAEVDNAGAALGLMCVKIKGVNMPAESIWIVDARHVQGLIAAVVEEPA